MVVGVLDLWCERRIYHGVLPPIAPFDHFIINIWEAESPRLESLSGLGIRGLHRPGGNLELLRVASTAPLIG